MKHDLVSNSLIRRAAAAVFALVLILAAGCKSQPSPRTDEQLTADVRAKIGGETALAGQNIQVSVANGVVTLSGTVSDPASRALAGNDGGTVAGVSTVVNNLTVQPGEPAVAPAVQPAPPGTAPQPAVSIAQPAKKPGQRLHSDHVNDPPTEVQTVQPAPPPHQVAENTPPPPPPAAQAPPPPPKPVIREVTLPAGTVIPIRVTETLDSKTAQTNDVFHGSLAGDVGIQGVIAISHGSPVMGRIVDAREAAHFKGASLLSIELTELTSRGKRIPLVTDTFSKEGAARGANTAEKAGGGAAFGAIVGALAGGGKGAAIGALAGGAAGTGVNAVTRGQQTVIPTETLINFRLQSPITLTVTLPPSGDQENPGIQDPQLHHR